MKKRGTIALGAVDLPVQEALAIKMVLPLLSGLAIVFEILVAWKCHVCNHFLVVEVKRVVPDPARRPGIGCDLFCPSLFVLPPLSPFLSCNNAVSVPLPHCVEGCAYAQGFWLEAMHLR